MAWVRIHDGAMSHPKLLRLSDKAFRLWVWGLTYSQQHLTDGWLPERSQPADLKRATNEIVAIGLWEKTDNGHQIHDYLDWNDSKSVVVEARQLAKVRMALVRDPELRKALRERDQDQCRFCGIEVNWADRKSRGGATYDHVRPGGGDTLDNLVIACRGCNSKKGKRTPAEAGMSLLPESRFVSRYINTKTSLVSSGLGSSSSSSSSVKRETPISGTLDAELADRAGAFCERYAELYSVHRRGARYFPRPALDYTKACELCQVWDNERLERLAVVFLKCEEPFAVSGSRTIGQFAAMASWADDRLREVESA